MQKTAKGAIMTMLKADADEGRITPQQHQDAYDRLKVMEDGRDILYYIKELCKD